MQIYANVKVALDVITLWAIRCMKFHRNAISGFHLIAHCVSRVLASEADERHGNPPQGNQELLVVRDKVGRPPGELGVRKSMECDIFSLQCFDTVGWATGRASGL